jgi:hypothetical protein
MTSLDTRASSRALEERLLTSVQGAVHAPESSSDGRRRKLCNEVAAVDGRRPTKRASIVFEGSPQSVITGANIHNIPSVRKAMLRSSDGDSSGEENSARLSSNAAAGAWTERLPLRKTDEMAGPPASATRCLLEQSLKKHMPEMAMPSFSAYDRALMLKLIMSTGSCDHGLDECVAAFREVLPQEPAELISATDDACGSQ